MAREWPEAAPRCRATRRRKAVAALTNGAVAISANAAREEVGVAADRPLGWQALTMRDPATGQPAT